MKLYKNILNYINYNINENTFSFPFSVGFFVVSIILLIIDFNILTIIASSILMIVSISINLLYYSSYKKYLKRKQRGELFKYFNDLIFNLAFNKEDFVPKLLTIYVGKEVYEALHYRRYVYGIRIKIDNARKGIDYGFEPKSNYMTKVEEFFEYE